MKIFADTRSKSVIQLLCKLLRNIVLSCPAPLASAANCSHIRARFFVPGSEVSHVIFCTLPIGGKFADNFTIYNFMYSGKWNVSRVS